MADWTPPTPIMTEALLERVSAAAALPDDASTDTPAQRDNRNLLAFISYAMIAAKTGQVRGNPDAQLLALFDPAMLNFELP